jgi:hypothetical protein
VPIDLVDPVALLFAAVDALTAAGLDHAVFGGLALAIYGEPRETKDADLAVANLSLDAARQALLTIGVTVVPAFADVQFGGLRLSRLTLLEGAKLNTVDFITPVSLRYSTVPLERAVRVPFEGRDIRVVAPEDFIVLKCLATRERDIGDAGNVLAALGDRLDLALIEAEVEQLAHEIPTHDVRGRLAKARIAAMAP